MIIWLVKCYDITDPPRAVSGRREQRFCWPCLAPLLKHIALPRENREPLLWEEAKCDLCGASNHLDPETVLREQVAKLCALILHHHRTRPRDLMEELAQI